MNRCTYGVIIALLLFNSLNTTAILVIFIMFTNRLIDNMESVPLIIDAKVNNIVGALGVAVDGKIDFVSVQFNQTLYGFMETTIDSFTGEFNDTLGSLYQLKTSVHDIQNDLAYLRNRSGEFENRAVDPI